MANDELSELKNEYEKLKSRYANLLTHAAYMEEYYAAMVYGSLFAYDIDVTEDKLISIPEVIAQYFHTKENFSYNELIKKICAINVAETNKDVVYETVCSESLLKAFDEGKRQVSIDYLGSHQNSPIIWFQNKIYLIQHPVSGHINGIVTIRDVQKEKMRDLTLQKKAHEDALTHLANRSYMEERIKLSLSETEEEDTLHCIILLDLDNFKFVNDHFGHQTGDAVLKAFAKMLSSKFRKDDIIARLGGDEFLVFMQDTKREIVEPRAKSILDATNVLMGEDSEVKVGCSIGITFYPNDAMSFEDLYKNADLALYHSKNQGKNAYTFFSKELK